MPNVSDTGFQGETTWDYLKRRWYETMEPDTRTASTGSGPNGHEPPWYDPFGWSVGTSGASSAPESVADKVTRYRVPLGIALAILAALVFFGGRQRR